jgi:hypothetical protein
MLCMCVPSISLFSTFPFITIFSLNGLIWVHTVLIRLSITRFPDFDSGSDDVIPQGEP